MTSPELSPDHSSRRAFLVERYVSAAHAAGLASSTLRLARLCAETDRTGPRVRYLYSAYLPAEDTCFCLFQAPSSEAVRALNQRAGFALDRIVEAALLPVDGTAVSGLRP
jgi:hypothetical protein